MDQQTYTLLFFFIFLQYTVETRFNHKRNGLTTGSYNTLNEYFTHSSEIFLMKYGFFNFEPLVSKVETMDFVISSFFNTAFFSEDFKIEVFYNEDKNGEIVTTKPFFNFLKKQDKLELFFFFNTFAFFWWQFQGEDQYGKLFKSSNTNEKQRKIVKLLFKNCKKSFYDQAKAMLFSNLLLEKGVLNEKKIEKELEMVKQNTFECISFEEAFLTFSLLNYHFSKN